MTLLLEVSCVHFSLRSNWGGIENTMKKLDIPDFPEIKDKMTNREHSPLKSPSTLCSTKAKKTGKKRIKSM